jgi:hypothetical protein
MARHREHRRGRARLDDAAGVHHRQFVRESGDDAEVVGDEDDAHAALLRQRLQQLDDLGLHGDVERRRGLVRDHQARLARQRHRDGHTLPESPRELVREVMRPDRRIGDADLAHAIHGLRPRLLPVAAP